MMRLTASAILAANDLAQETVEVPAWGGSVTVRELSVGERGAMALLADRAPEDLPAWLVAAAALDANGGPLFPPDEREANVKALSAKAQEPIKALAEAIMRLSGFGEQSQDVEKN